ncbi:hypothetical protein HMPREF0201_04121 [Cedecea davisae DSM 4568]|uniref:Uncharacterized protein n=1 Tax=Cedecea davisae DSM 4568 TaxID=566551 RepID=S3J1U3_9ENTR|nr:hypothetical protein HMPREF0201_04121 [Cedecea davisae DSM 4568]
MQHNAAQVAYFGTDIMLIHDYSLTLFEDEFSHGAINIASQLK